MMVQTLLQPLASCGQCSFTISQRFTRHTSCSNSILSRQCRSPYNTTRSSRRVHVPRAENKSSTEVRDQSGS